MKKPLFGLLTLSALFASGATSLAWSDAPYQQPPLARIYNSAGADAGQSIGVDSSVTATAVTSDTGNGVVIFYPSTGGANTVSFDPGNVHPPRSGNGLTLLVQSQGLSAVAVDPQTHAVYAAGETFNGSDYDCLIKKYDKNGSQIWSITHEFYQNQHDFCHDIAVDGNGHVIVAGTRVAPSSNYGAKLAKFDTNGNLLAENSNGIENCGPATPCNSQILKISVGGDGRVVALIKRYWFDWWIATWDTNLQKLPGNIGNHNSPFYIEPEDVAVDTNGNIYVAGRDYVKHNGSTESRHKLVRLDAAYNMTCEDSRLFGLVPAYYSWNDSWYGITLASNGHPYVTGADQRNIIAMEYDAACTPQWSNSTGAVTPLIYNVGSLEIGHDIGVDSNGDLHITGRKILSNDTHALTLKYSHL